MNKIKIIFFSLLMIFVLSACEFLDQIKEGVPAFTIENMLYKKNGEKGEGLPSGLYFDFSNKSDKKIIFMESKLNAFDLQTGAPAFAGRGTISSNFDIPIKAQESKELCIPLDNYIKSSMDMELYIDSFFISRIIYSDGSSWQDLFGAYAISSGGIK